jgi:hypothetical protein
MHRGCSKVNTTNAPRVLESAVSYCDIRDQVDMDSPLRVPESGVVIELVNYGVHLHAVGCISRKGLYLYFT